MAEKNITGISIFATQIAGQKKIITPIQLPRILQKSKGLTW